MAKASKVRIRAQATLLLAFFVFFNGWECAWGAQSDPTDSSPNLVRQIGEDFKNVFTTKENLVIVGAGLAAAGGASFFDDRIASSRLNSELNGGTTLDGVFESGEILGGGLLQAGGALAAYGLGKLSPGQVSRTWGGI